MSTKVPNRNILIHVAVLLRFANQTSVGVKGIGHVLVCVGC